MQRTLSPITEECRILDDNTQFDETNTQASLPTQDVPPIQDLNGEAGSVATTLTDKVTLSTIRTVVTAQVVGDGSSILPSSAALAAEGEQTCLEEGNDDFSEISGSGAGSVMSSGSGFSRSSSGVFLSTPVSPEIRKIENIDEELYEEGYDTDGDIGPFYDAVEHEEDLASNIEEEALPSREDYEAIVARAENPINNNTNPVNNDMTRRGENDDTIGDAGTFVLISDEDMNKMRNKELQDELGKRGLVKRGWKSELVAHLKKAMRDGVLIVDDNAASTTNIEPSSAELPGFSDGAYWEELIPQSAPVEEPTNPFQARAPTVPEEDHFHVPKKYNFDLTIQRKAFTGKVKTKVVKRYGQNRMQKVIYESRNYTEGRPCPDFISRHGLNTNSHPAAWFRAFCPDRLPQDQKPFETFCVAEWAAFLNLNAALYNAGNMTYKTFTNFTPEEIEKHIGVYILNGLSPSPDIKMKFRNQKNEPVNGNDAIHHALGPNATCRHKEFKKFFCVRDPRMVTPPRKTHPNFKVDRWLKHVNEISMEAWKLGSNISCDEQTQGFQGNHADKQRITYKAEGDGFQCDAICQNGYTYSFFFRNQPVPKEYL